MNEQIIPPIVQKYIDEVAKKYSKKPIQVKPKNSSKLMNAIGWLFRKIKINPRFMEDYITTIGNTIYYPDELLKSGDPINILSVVSHECIHVKDNNKFGLLFPISYLAPQIFAVLSLLAFVAVFGNKLWLLSLLFLLFLAPIPAFARYYWEKRAYRTSFVFNTYYYNGGEEGEKNIRNHVNKQMAEGFYYFTWPFPKSIDNDLKDMKFIDTEEYQEIATFIKANL